MTSEPASTTVTQWLGPPPTAAERERAAARLRRTAVIGSTASLVCACVYAAVGAGVSAAVSGACFVVFALIAWTVTSSRIHVAMFMNNLAAMSAVVAISHDMGGLTSPAVVWIPIVVRSTYLVLGVRAAVPSVVMTVAALLIIPFVSTVPLLSEAALDVARAGSLIVAMFASLFGAASEERLSAAAMRMLGRARDDAEEASRLKSEFVATVSHELRTPLNAIVGMSGLMLESKLDDRQREYASTTRGAAESLLVLVDDLLDISRIDARRVTLTPAPCDVRDVVASVHDMLSLRAREKGLAIELDVQTAPDSARVLVDAQRLRQVLTNLVDNAIKFTEHGTVTLRLATAPHGTLGHEVDVTLAVVDTGIGIPPEKRGVIFERFRQADSSTTRRFGGTGLGLAIAKDLLALMGGTISVDSTPGRGSTFVCTLRLPRAGAAASLEGTRVLLAEDNVVNQRLAVYLLTSLGCRVDVAGDGAEAVRLASERSYDVVLMDCHMPEMDGYRAAAAIRARFGSGLPILALTAAGSDEDVARAREAGMDELLQKPIDVEGIRASLTRVAPPRATAALGA
jgi:signal transduction histidine kinase/ActR/RegA family two-component response regulator